MALISIPGPAQVCLNAPAVQDGILDDDELNLFQTKCFAAPLQPHELSGIKTVVADKMPQVCNLSVLQLPHRTGTWLLSLPAWTIGVWCTWMRFRGAAYVQLAGTCLRGGSWPRPLSCHSADSGRAARHSLCL